MPWISVDEVIENNQKNLAGVEKEAIHNKSEPTVGREIVKRLSSTFPLNARLAGAINALVDTRQEATQQRAKITRESMETMEADFFSFKKKS